MSDTVETIYTDDKQRRVRIEYDMDGEDPREWEELVEIVTPDHSMTEHTDGAKFQSQHDRLYERGMGGAFGRYLKIFHNVEAFPVYRFEHSSVQLSLADFRDRWDSGMIGWAYINPDAETWEGMDPKGIISGLLESLTEWMNGEVYGYIVEHRRTGSIFINGVDTPLPYEDWVEEDDGSLWGLLGYTYAEREAKRALGIDVEEEA